VRFRFLTPDPEKAYVSRQLWLPKKYIRVAAVKAPLEFWTQSTHEQEYVRMWAETDTHLIVPREFLDRNGYSRWPFEFVDLTPLDYPHIEWPNVSIQPKDEIQAQAMLALQNNPAGLLNLSCGKGKTVMALWKTAQLQVPTLIVVNTTTLMTQWQERIREHLGYEGPIGHIQGDVFEWNHPIAVAMINTLANHADEFPPEFQRHWGLIIYDEVHHLAANHFSRAAPLFYGQRYGLTATPRREDGREEVFFFHIGRIFYSDLSQDLEPRVYFIRTPTEVNLNDPTVRDAVMDRAREVNLARLRVWLGAHPARNDLIAEHLTQMLDKGRKILALTHSVEHLSHMQDRFPDAGVIWSGVDQTVRMNILRQSQLTFATAQLAYEGLDEPSLDTLVVLTPFGAKNWIQQAIGRIQREHHCKMDPVVAIFDDHNIKKCEAVCRKAKSSLRRLGYDYQIVR